MRWRALGLIGLLGGLGGAINAWLCYRHIPMSPAAAKDFFEFSWWIIPAGTVHGAILAIVPIAIVGVVAHQRTLVRWLTLPLAGWLSGWLSYIPLNLYLDLFGHIPFHTRPTLDTILPTIGEWIAWPLHNHPHVTEALWRPFCFFGLVGSCYSLGLCVSRRWRVETLFVHLFIGSLSGVLGSLWWWILWSNGTLWYFSVIHGTIWGSLVGCGVWISQRSPQHR